MMKSMKLKKFIHSSNLIVRSGHELVTPLIGLIGVCEDRNSSFMQGPATAPLEIRKYLKIPSGNDSTELGIDDIHEHIMDYGDCHPLNSNLDTIFQTLQSPIATIISSKQVPLALGGDHSITSQLIKAISEEDRHKLKNNLKIVHFDAHSDIYENFEGNFNSHASPFARIFEAMPTVQLISLGVRTTNQAQRSQLKKYNVNTVEAKDFPSKGSDVESTFKSIISDEDMVYISIDIDVLEPGIAPGVSHREPGGLSVRQLIDAIHVIPGRIIGADIVEYNPLKDVDGITGHITAKICKEVAGKIVLQHRKDSSN